MFLGRLLAFRPHCVHFHWLHPFFVSRIGAVAYLRFGLFLFQFLVIKGMGVPIVWTVHNYTNHDRRNRSLERLMNRLLEYNSDAVIVHCTAARSMLEAQLAPANRKKIHVIPHGNYIGRYPEHAHRAITRKALGLDGDALVYLFLGGIRRYKGILGLVRAFKALGPGENLILLLAGRIQDADIEEDLFREIAEDPRIIGIFQFIPDEDIQIYMSAADVVVAPFQDVLTSGSVILAMSFGKAVVAPRIGCLPELVSEHGGFLYDARDSGGLRAALEAVVLHSDSIARRGERNRRAIRVNDWGSVAQATRQIYESVQPSARS